MAYLIFVSLLLLLLIAYYKFDRDLASPTIHFIMGFVVCAFMALFYVEEWELNKLHFHSFIMLVSGCIVFFLTELVYRKINQSDNIVVNIKNNYFVPIKSFKLILFIFLQIYSYYMMSRFMMSVASGSDTLGEALAYVDHESKYENESFYAPWYVNIPNTICQYGGYVWCSLFPYYMCKDGYKLQKILLATNLLLTIGGSFLTGSRGNAFTYVVTTAIFSYMLFRKQSNKKYVTLPKKIKIGIFAFFILVASTFMSLGTLIGRELNTEITPEYMFAVYCGAQIKNLDTYLTTNKIKEERLWARNTFGNFYNNLYGRLGLQLPKRNNDFLEFDNVNGYFLGNVRTAFATYYSDFQWSGIFLVAIFSLIMGILYHSVYYSDFFLNGRLNYWLLFYSWLSFSPIMSFFAEKFYGCFNIDGLVRFSVYWFFVIWFLQGKKSQYMMKLKKIKQK